jgi:glycosyltransferase involved in cell wall biosynthesis
MDVQISAVMANYNHASYIGGALDNLLELQQYFCEILVLDDCSTDNSLEIINTYATKYPLIKVLKNDVNRGVIYSYNRLFNEALGEYLVQQAADDYLISENMSKLLEAVEEYRGCGVFFGDIRFDHWWLKRIVELRQGCMPGYTAPNDFGEYLAGKYISQTGNILRRDLLLKYGGYRTEPEWLTDWLANNLVAYDGGIYYLPTVTAVMRIQRGTFSSKRWNCLHQRRAMRKMIRIIQMEYGDTLYPVLVKYRLFNYLGLSVPLSIMSDYRLRDHHWPQICWDVSLASAIEFFGKIIRLIKRWYIKLRL